ncbi:MAG: lipoprotein signal peptidase [Bacteroidetes bacterium ADurb.Bin397]|nr:MAG: lipoprotein signal peptidase [Bacteroidetes bacterium ADurb.Bin397]
MKRPLLIIFLVLLIDQTLKFWIKTNMYLGQEFHLAGDWFIIHFTENNGMAFGLEFAGEYGKLALSLFRIFAIGGIGWYLNHLVKNKAHVVLISSIAFIFAGALGNIIDSTFYGVIFSSSEFQLASLFPAEGGYSSLLHGKVVDMFYFPILKGNFPDWVPFWGGDYFIFFRPVFNIADASISVGVILILLFQGVIFKDTDTKKEGTSDSVDTTTEGSEVK